MLTTINKKLNKSYSGMIQGWGQLWVRQYLFHLILLVVVGA